MEETMKRFCLGVVIAAGLTLPAFGQGVDPILGTWKVNLEKSTYNGTFFEGMKSSIHTYTGEGQNFTNTIEMVDAQGQTSKSIFRHIYDGMPHPTSGSPDYDSSAYTRVGNTINAVRFRQGKAVEVAQLVIVPGKSITGNAEGIAANGQPYHYLLVLDRQ
jgi:hypothetical protein